MGNNAWIGWGLAALAVVVGYVQYGWQGLLLAVSITVFWLLLQFSRTLRVLKKAGQRPVGHVDSAVMLHTKLATGMRLLDVVSLTRALGERMGESPERWRWTDAGGAAVEVSLERGRVTHWELVRQAGEDAPAP